MTHAEAVPIARIDVAAIRAEVVLVAGGDDGMWPSVDFAREIEQRRSAAGRRTTVVTLPDAGHRAVLPGEPTPAPSGFNAHGGSPEADAALGRAAWPALAAALGLATS